MNESPPDSGSPTKKTPIVTKLVTGSKDPLRKSNSDPIKRPRTSFSHIIRNHHHNHFKRRGSPVAKCLLTLDGYSYVIVASPPDKASPSTSTQEDPAVQYQAAKNGQLSKQGSLKILRRSSSKSLSGRTSRLSSHADDDFLDSIDLAQEGLPTVESPEALEKAALRLRALLRKLRQGEVPAAAMQQNLQYAVEVLESYFLDEAKRLAEEEDELSEVEPDAVPPEVREWLASTFTRQLSGGRRKNDEKPRFRSVANAIRAGIFVERIYRRLNSATFLQLPPEVTRVLKRVDEWSFDVWVLHEVSNGTPARCLSYELLNRYGLLHKFKVPPSALEAFLAQVESGYQKYKNPYHNNVHAADVLQTVHYMLYQAGIMNWLSDLEILATLIAALIHDFEHTGTTNNFHVMSGTDTAMLYNDRAVLENHHISASFRILRAEETNILINLSREEFREFRTLVIDMVLATDMSSHFQQIKAMKTLLALPNEHLDKSKALSLVLHCCDISHPAKQWQIHEKWTKMLLEEFFRQGDKEHDLGLPYSPLCDRKNTLVAQSQIGFIDFIVEPSLSVCGDLLDKISTLSSTPATPTISEEPHTEPGGPIKRGLRQVHDVYRPWQDCLKHNKAKWKERATKDAELLEQKAEEEASTEDQTDTKEKSVSKTESVTEVVPEEEQSTTDGTEEEETTESNVDVDPEKSSQADSQT